MAMSPPTGLEKVLLKHFKPKEVKAMSTEKKVAGRKLSLLELAAEMKNVSHACKIMGYSRRQFHEIRRNYQIPLGPTDALIKSQCQVCRIHDTPHSPPLGAL